MKKTNDPKTLTLYCTYINFINYDVLQNNNELKKIDSDEKGEKEQLFLYLPPPENEYEPHSANMYTDKIPDDVPEHFEAKAVKTSLIPNTVQHSVSIKKPFIYSTVFSNVDMHASRWLCSIDLSRLDFDNKDPSSPEYVLMSLKAGMVKYANVFKVLCSYAGMQCCVIIGYAKGFDYKPGMKFDSDICSHSWNTVLIDNTWRLIDCHWAARRYIGIDFTDDNLHYKLDEFYFCPDPHQMIFTHFPNDVKWQLIELPISLEDFESLVTLKSNFFKNNLTIITHENAVTESAGQLMISFGIKDTSMQFMTTMKLRNDDCKELKNCVTYEMTDKKVSFFVRTPLYPFNVNYSLVIYASQIENGNIIDGRFSVVCEYEIVCCPILKNDKVVEKFPPMSSDRWGEMKGNERFPSEGEYCLEIYCNDPSIDNTSLVLIFQYLLVVEESNIKDSMNKPNFKRSIWPTLQNGFLGKQNDFFDNLKIINVKDSYIKNHESSCTISFKRLDLNLDMISNFTYFEKVLNVKNKSKCPHFKEIDLKQFLLVECLNDNIDVSYKFIEYGFYKCSFFCQNTSNNSNAYPNIFNMIIEYEPNYYSPESQISACNLKETVSPFPTVFTKFRKHGGKIFTPLSKQLSQNTPVLFRFTVAGAIKVLLNYDNYRIPLICDLKTGIWELSHTFPILTCKVQILSLYDLSKNKMNLALLIVLSLLGFCIAVPRLSVSERSKLYPDVLMEKYRNGSYCKVCHSFVDYIKNEIKRKGVKIIEITTICGDVDSILFSSVCDTIYDGVIDGMYLIPLFKSIKQYCKIFMACEELD
ncbi:hypothetical protein A3Q56_03165 [Intoshia linei]|uniref:Saposin B-type domain-containing protein n=1 Tax=Intoshia linei TaxID=1819745 RepID=A0A177B481_9BILA|nr:hypothetical protein A3Q56_03165 [Intoshia linei]